MTDLETLLQGWADTANKATGGPWEVDEIPETGECRVTTRMRDENFDLCEFSAITSGGSYFNDANLIATTRTVVPALVSVVQELLQLHHEVDGHCAVCLTYRSPMPGHEPWPCPSVRVIEKLKEAEQ